MALIVRAELPDNGDQAMSWRSVGAGKAGDTPHTSGSSALRRASRQGGSDWSVTQGTSFCSIEVVVVDVTP